jgi:hypothetical protein
MFLMCFLMVLMSNVNFFKKIIMIRFQLKNIFEKHHASHYETHI